MEPWREQAWSRIVVFLKIALPLSALGLLSTLFLPSRSIDPRTTLPFSQKEVEARARGQQMTALTFAGATVEGHLISLTADSAGPDSLDANTINTEHPAAVIKMSDGTQILLRANSGQVNEPGNTAHLTGNVELASTAGYTVNSEDITTALTRLDLLSPGPVTGSGPPGRFSAGKMILSTNRETGAATMLFTDWVHLIYEPKN